MAKQKPVFIHPFDTSAAMSVPLNMPGGRNLFLRLVAWGTALMLLAYAIFGRSLLANYTDLIIASLELDETNPDPEAAMALMGQIWSLLGSASLIFLLLWAVYVMAETAMHKNIFRGTDHGVFPMRFGKDEARVMLTQLVLSICMMGVYILIVIGIVVLFAFVGVMASFSTAMAIIAGLAAFAGTIFLFGWLLHVCLRWAPAAALSVRDDKLSIFDGWNITRGRGWPLFGSYLIVGIVGYVLIYLIMGLGMYLAFGDIQALMVMSGMDVDDPTALFERLGDMIKSPRVMVTLVIFTILYVLTLMVWYMCFWGIGNYAAQLDGKEKGLI